jgi:hypothetical protein
MAFPALPLLNRSTLKMTSFMSNPPTVFTGQPGTPGLAEAATGAETEMRACRAAPQSISDSTLEMSVPSSLTVSVALPNSAVRVH